MTENIKNISQENNADNTISNKKDMNDLGTWERVKKFSFENKALLFTLSIFIFVVIFLVASILVIIFPGSDNNKSSLITKTKAEQNELLAKVIRNNPKELILKSPEILENEIEQTETVQENTIIGDPQIPFPEIKANSNPIGLDSNDYIAPETDEYNYRVSNITITKGPASSICQDSFMSESYQTTVEEFFAEDKSYFKSTYLNENGYYSYYLSLTGKNEADYYYYIGGDFAVRFLYEVDSNFFNGYNYINSNPVSYPVYSEVDLQNIVSQYFGDDAYIIEGLIEDNKELLLIESSYQNTCNDSLEKIIVQYKVDPKTFTIIESNSYLNNVSMSNLISTYKIEEQRYKVNYSEIQDNFDLEATNKNLEVKNVDYRNNPYSRESEADRLIDYLTTKDIDLLIPVQEDYSLLATFSGKMPVRVENEDYYLQKEFYPKNQSGEKEYLEQIDYYNNSSIVETYFQQEDQYLNIYIATYENDVDVENVLRQRYLNSFQSLFESSYQINLTIDGVLNTTELYSYIYQSSYNVVSYPTSYMQDISYINSFSPLEFSNNNYIFSAIEEGIDSSLKDSSYKLINTKDESFKDYSEKIKEVFLKYY